MRIVKALAVSMMVLGVSIGMMLAQAPPGGAGPSVRRQATAR